MKVRTWIKLIALIIGILLGPYALSSAKASQPPLQWDFMPFMFIGSVVSFLFVIGIQLVRKDPKYSRSMLRIFLPLSVFIVGSGIGALATDLFSGVFGPASIFFLIIGAGLSIGVLLARLVFNAKFSNAL